MQQKCFCIIWLTSEETKDKAKAEGLIYKDLINRK